MKSRQIKLELEKSVTCEFVSNTFHLVVHQTCCPEREGARAKVCGLGSGRQTA